MLLLIYLCKATHFFQQQHYKYLLFAEQKHVRDVKEEMEDIAIAKSPEGLGGGTPGAVEAGKRSSAKMGPDSNQSTSSKRARVTDEVSLPYFV